MGGDSFLTAETACKLNAAGVGTTQMFAIPVVAFMCSDLQTSAPGIANIGQLFSMRWSRNNELPDLIGGVSLACRSSLAASEASRIGNTRRCFHARPRDATIFAGGENEHGI
jgi:hypothetical protein